MQRVSAFTRQLLSVPVAAVPQEEEEQQLGPSQEDMMRLMQVVIDYRKSVDALYNEGVMPKMSLFDVLLATKHNFPSQTTVSHETLLDAAKAEGTLEPLSLLPGPWQRARTTGEQLDILHEIDSLFRTGTDVFQWARYQLDFGSQGLSSNIAIPALVLRGKGSARESYISSRVILAHPDDVERIARTHVRKEGNFTGILFDSVISTTDNEYWRAQRAHLAEAFMPLSSLAAIFPVSLARAKHCASRLGDLARSGTPVDMSDFLLHEAQAQLQLALLGAPESLMEKTNKEVRAAFMGDIEHGRVGALGEAMKALMEIAATDPTLGLPTDPQGVRGPLSRAVQTSNLPMHTNYGNVLLILFAGHDTTGHTMTWLLFELARHPDLQRKLQREVDAFFEGLGGRDPEYRDLASLDFMDRCVTETLRMWPAVANGTFRQLQYADQVMGPDGKQVTLPKGTFVNIVNWSRHRNPDLWGADVNEWNPDRAFKDEEIARVGRPLAALSPQSDRFSPFAHKPRECLGRNFAQMEMRLIMMQLLHAFDFSLAPPYDRLVGATNSATPGVNDFRGINRGTMGPMDLEFTTDHAWGKRHYYAMKFHAQARSK